MGRRILAVLAALLVLLWAAVPAYAASPAVDSAYLTREPWQNVPFTEFQGDGVIGTYKIYADTANQCLYFAVSMQDQQVEPGANTAAVALNLQVSSAKFSTKKFTFTTGTDKALQSYDGIASGCNMQVEILENSGGYGIADGNAYFAIALDKSLCGPLTVRLDYNCGERGICLLEHAAFDYTLPEKTTKSRNARAGTKQSTRQTTTKKKKESTTKFTYTGTVPHTAKSARKSSAQTVTKFAYTGGTSTGDTEEELPVQTGGTAVLTDGTYTAAVAPTHRSTVANILIYLAIALATAAVITLVAGIIKSRKAKGGRSPGKTETRGRTENRRIRRIAKQKATDDRWLFVTSQTGLGLRGGSGSRQVGVVDLPIIGKGQLAGAADHSMIAVVQAQQLVGEGDISLRRFVPQRRIQVPTSYIFYKKKNPLMTVHQRVCRLRTILIRVTERTGRRERRCLRRSKTAPGPPRR